MRRYLRDPVRALDPGTTTLKDLVYGWDNESWSAQDEYLCACIDAALETPGPILECGSGLSTILIGAIAQRRGAPHWALEHTPEWATRVGGTLTRFRVTAAQLHVAPLRDYGEYVWYDPPRDELPRQFTLVICDGPPGATPGGRLGLVPEMHQRMAPGSVILLDDAAREGERAIARRWEDRLGATGEIRGSRKPYLRLVLPG
jgi:predicted O-methyltransferase YrrM